MGEYSAVQLSQARGAWEIVKRPIPTPGKGEVLIKVQACGICHGDEVVRNGLFGAKFPRVPGHEVAGTVVKSGEGVNWLKEGQHVGVGWHGGWCGSCDYCRTGQYSFCKAHVITGIHFDGGYGQYMVAPQFAVAKMPDGLSFDEAAVLMCAGITLYNSLRNCGAKAGDIVAIQGIGGLGHLGLQYCRKMGFRTIALSTSPDKEKAAKELGADIYLDSSKQNVVQELQKLGGAKVIVSTATSGKAMAEVYEGLAPGGKLVVIGASMEPLPITAMQLIAKSATIQGWASGHAKDSEETMNFSHHAGIHPIIEKFPLSKVSEAYERMLSNKARFRVVLNPQE